MVPITLNELELLFPGTPASTLEKYIEPLNDILPKYEINTNLRVAMFLTQCGEESFYFNKTTENLNYSADSLWKTFRNKFASYNECIPYAHNPEKIANRVYANRFGNGNEASGDGWKYRGRGLLQLTFKANYEAFAAAIGKSLDDTIAYITTPAGAVEVSCWYFKTRNINMYSDKENVPAVTHLINGGYNGLIDRQNLYKKARKVFP